MKTEKTIVILLIPLLFVLFLRLPFPLVWDNFIADRFGCPCTNPDFNSNHITTYVWQIISVVAALISIPCAFRIPKDIWPFRIVYIGVMAWLCYRLGSLFALSFMLK